MKISLNSWFNCVFYVNKKMKKVKSVDIQMKKLDKTYKLYSKLVKKISILIVQLKISYQAQVL